MLSWFASSNPDGSEWSISKTAGSDELETPHKGLLTDLNNAQEKIALLPDYGFNSKNTKLPAEAPVSEPVVDAGKTVSGLVVQNFAFWIRCNVARSPENTVRMRIARCQIIRHPSIVRLGCLAVAGSVNRHRQRIADIEAINSV